MNLHFNCPACGSLIEVDPVNAGRLVRCGKCGQSVQAPAVQGGAQSRVRNDLPGHPPHSGQDAARNIRAKQRNQLPIILGVIAGLFVVCAGCAGTLYIAFANTSLDMLESSKQNIAKAHITAKLVPAVERFRLDSNGEPPESLEDLVNNPKAGLTADDLMDPWGRPFLYSSPSTHGGEFDIWAQSPSGKVIGNWTP